MQATHSWSWCMGFGYMQPEARCGIQTGHYHCRVCGLQAFDDTVDGLVYVAYENRKRGIREYEHVPKQCPIPEHLKPYRVRHPRRPRRAVRNAS